MPRSLKVLVTGLPKAGTSSWIYSLAFNKMPSFNLRHNLHPMYITRKKTSFELIDASLEKIPATSTIDHCIFFHHRTLVKKEKEKYQNMINLPISFYNSRCDSAYVNSGNSNKISSKCKINKFLPLDLIIRSEQ